MNENNTFCDWDIIRHSYRNVHGYFSIVVCVFGSISNIFNICVLRTKEMRSPTNIILIGIAITELLQMLEYIPFIFHRHLLNSRNYVWHYTYSWAIFYKYHAMVSVTLHFISCCLTVLLSIWRYNFISKLHVQNICNSQKNTTFVILFMYLVCPIFCYPILRYSKIRAEEQLADQNGRMVLKHEKSGRNESELKTYPIYLVDVDDPHNVSFWIYAICLKLLPCILLAIFFSMIMSVLIKRNNKRKQRRKRLLSNYSLVGLNDNRNRHEIQIYKENQNDRTTMMLLIILLLFLITEIPLSVLGLIGAVLGKTFIEKCYAPLGKNIILIFVCIY